MIGRLPAAALAPTGKATARVIRAVDCRAMPWKNGGGATTEVAVHPPGAGLADFDWRVSMATVATDGPFSAFPGVDRTLTVLEGDGLRLTIGDAAPAELRRHSAPRSFPADMPTRATLLGSAVSDLNVMTRRGAWRHVVTPVEGHAHEGFERTTTTSTVLWLCHRGRVDIAGPAGAARLGRLDAWLVEPSSPAVWRIAPQDDVELFLIELDRGEAVKADE